MTNLHTNVRPEIYQFNLGKFRITNILDGYFHREDMHPFTATNASAPEIEKIAKQHFLPFPKLEHNFVPTLIETSDALIAFDPGFGKRAPGPSAGWYNRLLEKTGYSPEQVTHVVISHGHPDHIANLTTDGTPTFKNAEIIISRIEFEFWSGDSLIPDFRGPTRKMFQEVVVPLADRCRFVEPDALLVNGITALNAFGHSAGHMAFHVESEGAELMLLSDTIAHFAVSLANLEWQFSMDDNPEMAITTRKRLVEMAASKNAPVIAFHMPFPSVGYIEKTSSGFKWLPATYQMNI
uniref:Metallo-beta-lactamase domain-containing protein n=1 Tax=Uncultured marine bacterium 66A03 TaxID=331677 RepID=Q4PNG7_UNCMB|nr:hypothetical protein [uncultured marine bacterium 66A03]